MPSSPSVAHGLPKESGVHYAQSPFSAEHHTNNVFSMTHVSLTRSSRLHLRRNGGYSLIEGIVTVAVLAILSVLVLTGLVAARRGATVRNAAEQFASVLRATITLAQSGVKASGCGSAPACSQYRLQFSANGDVYSRQTTNGFGSTSFRLPDDTVFAAAGNLVIQYRPPVINVSAPGAYQIRHRGNASVSALICVSALGSVEVSRTGGCS